MLDLNQLPSAYKAEALPHELIIMLCPMMGDYQSFHTFRHRMRPTICVHIAATSELSGTKALPSIPSTCDPALELPLELRPLHVDCCSSLHWLRLVPAKGPARFRYSVTLTFTDPVLLQNSLPLKEATDVPVQFVLA